jgi:lysozyme
MTRKRIIGGAVIISALTIWFVTNNEGTVYKAYPDQGGVWTICVGHTGPTIRPGQRATQAECDEYLRQDLQKAADAVDTLVKVSLNDNQRTALIDFTFNVGTKAFAKSTLLRKLNAGCYECVGPELLKWIIVAGKPNKGVYNRRVRTAALFNRKVS